MIYLYYIITVILTLVWLAVLFIPPFVILSDTPKDQQKFELQVWTAAVGGGFLFVLTWPIILALAVPVIIVYGLFQAIRLLIKKPWKTT